MNRKIEEAKTMNIFNHKYKELIEQHVNLSTSINTI